MTGELHGHPYRDRGTVLACELERLLRYNPPARFSIAEVLAHVSHSEGHCYRARVDRFLAEEMPEFEPDDAQMHLDLYRNADPEEEFGQFEGPTRGER